MQSKGFTLIETLVYIGLFAIIMTGLIAGAFFLIDGAAKTRNRVVIENEANFIFRKIDWMLNGDIVDVSEVPTDVLFIDKSTNPNYTVDVVDEVIRVNGDTLSSSKVKVTDFSVEVLPQSGVVPQAVRVSFELNGRAFASALRYNRVIPTP